MLIVSLTVDNGMSVNSAPKQLVLKKKLNTSLHTQASSSPFRTVLLSGPDSLIHIGHGAA